MLLCVGARPRACEKSVRLPSGRVDLNRSPSSLPGSPRDALTLSSARRAVEADRTFPLVPRKPLPANEFADQAFAGTKNRRLGGKFPLDDMPIRTQSLSVLRSRKHIGQETAWSAHGLLAKAGGDRDDSTAA